jgi:DNA mismatch repair protein MutL
MGFGVAEFGGDSFVIDALPSFFMAGEPLAFLKAFAHNLEDESARDSRTRWTEEVVAQAACKASVKARDHLTLAEIEKLVVDLAGTTMPYTCPHGRPTLIFTSFRELSRKFGRT